jgi:hypothetical protein
MHGPGLIQKHKRSTDAPSSPDKAKLRKSSPAMASQDCLRRLRHRLRPSAPQHSAGESVPVSELLLAFGAGQAGPPPVPLGDVE